VYFNPDYSSVGVTLSDNVTAGSVLKHFYTNRHLLEYDAYFVEVQGPSLLGTYNP
jgi:hypothetical protein